ncbi:Putative motility protein [Propionispira arboris]|uniref:Putative motility protein n=1 Tax=Propionispira arboris TaxID=84035 RepID=A0A1H7CP41_9FIRM|nr:YjfB family protein [Propionispira arboris]SEJ87545.1 Putative motility protein [Propionispira arboris]
MDMDMSIASLSVGLSQYKTDQKLGVSLLKMSMNDMSNDVGALLPSTSDTGNMAVDPSVGSVLDVKA